MKSFVQTFFETLSRIQFEHLLFRDGIIFSIVGIICFYGANVSCLPAVYYTSADIGGILMQVTPLCTYFLVVVMKMESIPNLREVNGFLKIAGILFASTGAVIVILGAQSNTGFMTRSERTGLQIFGFVSLFAHILCHSLSVVVQKKYLFSAPDSKWKYRPLYVTAWAMLCYTCFAGAVCLAYVGQPKTFMDPITGTALVPLFYSIFITAGVSYTLTTWCTSQIDSSIVSATWPLTAIFCIVFAFFLTGEVLNTTQIMGCLIIFLAEGMVAWGNYLKENLDEDYKKEIL